MTTCSSHTSANGLQGLISYSEATRFTPSKRREAEAWCAANGRALGQHVLYPRSKGFIACVQKLRKAPHVKAVYDVTIAYANEDGLRFQQAPSFAQTLLLSNLSEKWRFFVHVDRIELEDLPQQDDQLAKWLEHRWVVKGDRLTLLKERLISGLTWEPF